MTAESRAHARWHGDLMTGAGTIDHVGSGTFGPLEVTWAARTGEEQGKTSPEELIAAAHAACYSMALANILAKQDTPPTDLSTSVTVTQTRAPERWQCSIVVSAGHPNVNDTTAGRRRVTSATFSS